MARIAFLFPGQGAQYVGMGQSLCETLPAAAKLFAEASSLLGYDLLEVCKNGPAERLDSTAVSQPAIFVASLAALESLRTTNPEILSDGVATAGLSLGEYSALVFSGAIQFHDGLRVVKQRGEAMQSSADANPGAMLSILGMDVPGVQAIVEKGREKGLVQVANLLCPGNTVISGVRAAVEEVNRLAVEAGAKTVKLAVSGAFHTSLMKPADQKLAEALESIPIQSPRVPVWSNVDAKPHTDPKEIRELLIKQVLQPVLWEQTLRGLLESGCDRFYEIGPGRVLAGLLKRVQRKIDLTNIAA